MLFSGTYDFFAEPLTQLKGINKKTVPLCRLVSDIVNAQGSWKEFSTASRPCFRHGTTWSPQYLASLTLLEYRILVVLEASLNINFLMQRLITLTSRGGGVLPYIR